MEKRLDSSLEKKGRGPAIPDQINWKLAEIYVRNPKSQAKEIMKELHAFLKKNGQYPEGWPGLSIIQKEIADYRKRYKAIIALGMDNPWTIDSLKDDDFRTSPEALPSIIKVWYKRREAHRLALSNRQAMWIARLYALTDDIDSLDQMSSCLSLRELVSELVGRTDEKGIEFLLQYVINGYHLVQPDPRLNNDIKPFAEEFGALVDLNP